MTMETANSAQRSLSTGKVIPVAEIHYGLICTSMLIGTMASMFGCMIAARCHRRFAFIFCLAMTLLDASLLVVLLLRLPDTLSPAPWTASTLLLTVLGLWESRRLFLESRRQLSPVSIKESSDHLPCALCFAWENGQPCLKNFKMDELSHQVTGKALLNANEFWEAIAPQPIVSLSNGQTWSFERMRLTLSGQSVYQITGTNITEEARLQRELEKENLRLQSMNRRLRQYGQEVQELTREKEILRAKTRVHDEIGHVLLQTRQFLSGARGDAESICAEWLQNTHLLLEKYADEKRMDTFEQLSRAAKAIGVTIERSGSFPEDSTENALLVEAAARECLTNLVRHANGTRLEILGEATAMGWKIRYLNDGDLPVKPIVEGSGLTALRAQIEAAGGGMVVEHAPRFQLTLILPQERRDTQ